MYIFIYIAHMVKICTFYGKKMGQTEQYCKLIL